MDIRIRRVIMSIFFLVFFIMAPVLILYASGYRFDYKRVRLIRTGNIFLEMQGPRNADIFINDEHYGEKLDRKLFIKNLIPDEYHIRVEKAGFFPWQKRLQVQANLTSFEKNIVLFSKSEPVLIDPNIAESITVSSDGKTVLYSTIREDVREIFIMKVKEPNPELIYRNNAAENTNFYWSEDGNYIVIDGSVTKTVISSQAPYEPIKTPIQVQELVLSTNGLTDKAFSLEKSKLFLTDLNTQKRTEVLFEKHGEILPSLASFGGTYYFAETSNQATIIYGYNELRNLTYTLAELPTSKAYDFIETTEKWIAIRNTDIDKVYIIKRPSDDTQLEFSRDTVTLDGSDVIFSHNKDKILALSQNELSLYDTNTRTVSLIERLSSQINGAFWFHDDAHVFLSTGENIIISDLDTTQEIEKIEILTKSRKIHSISAVDKETIIFSGEVDGVPGIYLLSLN